MNASTPSISTTGSERPVARLELGVATDVDEVELESEFRPSLRDDLDSARAETAIRSVVDGDAALYG